MALSVARLAGAGLRRSTAPACAAAFSSSGIGIFGRTSFRPSVMVSDVPFQKVEDHFDGWTAEELAWARHIIDTKLTNKGLAVLGTGQDARMETMVRTVTKELRVLKTEISEMKNKGDVAAVPIGKTKTINALSVLTLLLKVEEVWPMLPVMKAWIKSILG